MTTGGGAQAAQDDDPKRLIEQVVAMGDEFPGPAEDLLLSWILSLAPGVDAPAAARRLVARYAARLEAAAPGRPLGRLWRLLRQTAETPNGTGRGRRRGGAEGRRG